MFFFGRTERLHQAMVVCVLQDRIYWPELKAIMKDQMMTEELAVASTLPVETSW